MIPGGFGIRGIEGKVEAIRFARERKIPYLGLCLGMQCAVIEFARNIGGFTNANSSEFDNKTPDPVIDLLPGQQDVQDLGGTMRLGAFPCRVVEGTLAHRVYGEIDVSERHRHRYEFNMAYREVLTAKGLVISGCSPDNTLVEIIELPDHPWFVGTQFHPEFHSRFHHPHPLFTSFIGAALQKKFGR